GVVVPPPPSSSPGGTSSGTSGTGPVGPPGVSTGGTTSGTIAVPSPPAVSHDGEVKTLDWSGTAAVGAKRRAALVAPVTADTDACAMTVPARCDPAPSVAELPMRQNTLHSCTSPMKAIVLPAPVVRVLTAVKMNTSSASP